MALVGTTLTGCIVAPSAEDPGARDVPMPFAPFPAGTDVGTTRLFTRVGEPGLPEGIALDGDRLYVSSVEQQGPGVVFEHDLATGAHVQTFPLESPEAQIGVNGNGVFGLALDAQGRIYAAQQVGARVIRLDPQAGGAQEVYAQLPDLPTCSISPVGPCSPTASDYKPWVNGVAFGPGGTLYVSDLLQATIFRVPPGGGAVEPWFQDPRFEGYGPNGIAVSPGDEFLYVAHSFLGAGANGAYAGGGTVWRIPLDAAPESRQMELVHHYPGWALDGLAFGASGRLYVTLLGTDFMGGYVSVLAPDGQEVTAFPSPEENDRLEVPYHVPANVAFHDVHRSILISNVARSDHPDHWAVLEAFVDDTGRPLHRPEVP